MNEFSLAAPARKNFSRLNLFLILSILSIHLIGLLNLYSATNNIAPHLQRVFTMQLFWLSASWLVFTLTTFINYSYFLRLAPLIYALNILALVAVFFIGNTSNGAQRWIDLGFFRYQPSETMKLACVMMLARALSSYDTDRGLGFKDLIYPLLILILPFALTVKQPDLGTALLLFMVGGLLILAMKIKRSVLITAICLGAVAIPTVWSFGLKSYQRSRILTFLSPNSDPRGAGYNSIQAKIAVGSGKFSGKGFLKGTQSQLEFLPEKHTDFIFCVLSEEHGFVGAMVLLGLFSILLISILQCAGSSSDLPGALLGVGVFAMVLFHLFVNIGMVTGLLPIVGVPLPLVSYGGSANITMMASLGLASSIYYHKDLF